MEARRTKERKNWVNDGEREEEGKEDIKEKKSG